MPGSYMWEGEGLGMGETCEEERDVRRRACEDGRDV